MGGSWVRSELQPRRHDLGWLRQLRYLGKSTAQVRVLGGETRLVQKEERSPTVQSTIVYLSKGARLFSSTLGTVQPDNR